MSDFIFTDAVRANAGVTTPVSTTTNVGGLTALSLSASQILSPLIGTSNTQELRLQTNNNTIVRITSAGTVGINVPLNDEWSSASTRKLYVSGNNFPNDDAVFNVYRTSFGSPSGSNYAGAVGGGASNGIFRIIAGGNFPGGQIDLTGGLYTGAGEVPAGSIVFRTGTGIGQRPEVMRIDSAGNVGLGMTPSAWSGLSNNTLETSSYALQNIGLDTVYFSQNVTHTGGGTPRYKGSYAASYYSQSSGNHQFFTASSGTAGNAITFSERLRIDTSGNVGIGGTPTCKLDVIGGTGDTQTLLRVRTGSATEANNAGLWVTAQPHATAANRYVYLLWDADGANASGGDYFLIQKNGNSGHVELNQYSNSHMAFLTTGTERLRIGSAGNIYFPGAATTASAANAVLNSGSTPANELLRSTSSLRYKTEIEDLWPNKSDLIYSLRPVWYRSLCTGDRHDWSWYGLIAEEVAELEPRLVTWTYLPEDYHQVVSHETITTEISGVSSTETTPVSTTELKPDAVLKPDGVQYDRLTIFLIKAVQELKAENDSLKSRITALEAA